MEVKKPYLRSGRCDSGIAPGGNARGRGRQDDVIAGVGSTRYFTGSSAGTASSARDLSRVQGAAVTAAEADDEMTGTAASRRSSGSSRSSRGWAVELFGTPLSDRFPAGGLRLPGASSGWTLGVPMLSAMSGA